MKLSAFHTYALVAVMLGVLSGCSAKCSCPVCPAPSAQQPQTTIIHEPD